MIWRLKLWIPTNYVRLCVPSFLELTRLYKIVELVILCNIGLWWEKEYLQNQIILVDGEQRKIMMKLEHRQQCTNSASASSLTFHCNITQSSVTYNWNHPSWNETCCAQTPLSVSENQRKLWEITPWFKKIAGYRLYKLIEFKTTLEPRSSVTKRINN